MIIKLKVWQYRLSKRNFDAFENLKILVSTNNGNLSDEILNCFIQHLKDVQCYLREYFQILNKPKLWIIYPCNLNF